MHYNADVKITSINQLLGLNRTFYQTFALQFSSTRMRLQPGVKKVLPMILESNRILDLGCGNGELAFTLKRMDFRGSYTGLDFCAGLLEIARQRISNQAYPVEPGFTFLERDITTPDWENGLPIEKYNLVIALAVLHHIPSMSMRLGLLKKIHQVLVTIHEKQQPPLFIHSVWQFLPSSRLKSRLVAWEKIGLSPQEVEPDDYLLDWKHGGYGLRYVHHFNPHELAEMANQSGFDIIDTFYSDGENDKLGLYQIWRPINNFR